MTYERQFFQYLDNLKRRMDAKPLNLGGVSSSGGGVGGPPGGFLGQLPQSKITYDKLEAATAYTPSSGTSLLDNLNHIRHQIATISGGGGAIAIQEDDVEVVGTATIINFEGGVSVADEGGGKVTVTVTASGSGADEDAIHDNVAGEINLITGKTIPVDADIIVIEDSEDSWNKKKLTVANLAATISGSGGAATFLELTDTPSSYSGKAGYSAVVNQSQDALEFVQVSGSGGSSGFYYIREDLTSQIPDGSDNFDLLYTPASGSLILHYNGLTQQFDNFTVISSGVHTSWSPVSGDILLAEYYYGNPSEGVINPTITVISGSTTINSVSTIKFEGMKVTDDGGGQVTVSGSTATGGGTVTPDYTYWSADAPPASPSAYDDEFDDTSFDTGLWTDFDIPSTLTYSEYEYGLVFTGHETDYDVQGIYQDCPVGSGFSIITKISSLWESSDDLKCGLMLLEDTTNLSTSDIIYFTSVIGGSGPGIQVEKFNAYNSYLGNVASDNDNKWENTFYLRIRATSGNEWYFDVSSDGIGWLNKDGWNANGANATRLWEPEGMGICIRGNTTSPKFLIHWFRYTTDDDVTDVVYGDRINGYRGT